MRDPKRIYPFCVKLAEIWASECPDLRFGQIAYILSTLEENVFDVEDEEMIKLIEKRFKK